MVSGVEEAQMADRKVVKVLREGSEDEWLAFVQARKLAGKQIDLAEADLSHADLSGRDLSGTRLVRANLCHANLAGANLEGCDCERMLAVGASFAGANLRRILGIGANFRQAVLVEVQAGRGYFAEATFFQANLAAANLSFARLDDANLIEANLVGADLTEAALVRTTLDQAICRGATFCNAFFVAAQAAGTDFTAADFRAARLGQMNLEYVRYSGEEFLGAREVNTGSLANNMIPRSLSVLDIQQLVDRVRVLGGETHSKRSGSEAPAGPVRPVDTPRGTRPGPRGKAPEQER